MNLAAFLARCARIFPDHLAQTVCVALVLLSGSFVAAAEPPAVIVNRMLTAGGGKEVDAAVVVVSIDARPVAEKKSRFEVAPGQHAIEVTCTARVFVGMGTVDFPGKSVLALLAESGRVYRLDAKVTVKGDCTPVLE